MTLILLSLVVNVLVAGYMGFAIGFRLNRMLPGLDEVFGPDSTSRQILACLYLAIAVCSVVALADSSLRLRIIVVLFPLQIFYKVLSAFLVTDRRNPVPKANLAISVLHGVSLYYAFTRL
ncbi:MAG: hypothetical protein WCH40_04215 [Verrucomicrobiales bacterium]